MPESIKVKKRRVLSRDHDDIARYINEQYKLRKNNEFRKTHEKHWKEVDRQIAMEAPYVLNDAGKPDKVGSWHNAIQLGDLTDASETITADMLRLVLPLERRYLQPHVELQPIIDEDGEAIPPDPVQQRAINGVLRNLMVQQHKDFGFRGRLKLAMKEMLHHGSVVATVDQEKILKYHTGTRPDHLKAPMPTIHSMWNCYPDPSPTIQGTEIFYKGSMLIMYSMKYQDALEMPGWINKDKLREQYADTDLDEHIEILYYYGDIFLKRYDSNLLFPNRKTTVSGNTFLQSIVYDTPYSPIIYTGYERDDVRDPYFTSPIVKRAPMGKFATHMANRTMDSVDLKVKPPLSYDSLDNSMKGAGPEIYPGAKIGSRGGLNVKTLDVGDPATGLAALQWAKQSMQEGTTVDPVRKGVAPGTEQTATEVIKTEQRAEVREVEFAQQIEAEFMLPYFIMQHDINRKKMETYPFYNDEPGTPDFLRYKRSDIAMMSSVIFEVTGSRGILGEQERNDRFAATVALAGQNQFIAQTTDWQEVGRQLWQDSKQKDPERFILASDRNEEIQQALQEAQGQFEQQIQAIQQQVQQLQQKAQTDEDARRSAEASLEQARIQGEQQKLRIEQLQLEKTSIQEQMRLNEQQERDEKDLQRQRDALAKQEMELRERAAQPVERPEKQTEAKSGPESQTINVITGGDAEKRIELVRKDGIIQEAKVIPISEAKKED